MSIEQSDAFAPSAGPAAKALFSGSCLLRLRTCVFGRAARALFTRPRSLGTQGEAAGPGVGRGIGRRQRQTQAAMSAGAGAGAGAGSGSNPAAASTGGKSSGIIHQSTLPEEPLKDGTGQPSSTQLHVACGS